MSIDFYTLVSFKINYMCEVEEDALQIAEKREAKGKGEKERYTPSEFRVPKNSKERFKRSLCK